MKFIYMADTHIGADDNTGYRQQPRYLKHFAKLMVHLREWIETRSDIDFIIHGGDIIEETSLENILAAKDCFTSLPCPVYLTLGNHDLTDTNALDLWFSEASELFTGNTADSTFFMGNIRFDLASCHWGKIPYLWNPEDPQVPWLLPKQLNNLRDNTKECKYRILVTHSPPCGLPPQQTGLEQPLHPPEGNFQEVLGSLSSEPYTPLVLGAHTHMNMACPRDSQFYVTASAFSEAPFEFKLIECNSNSIKMETFNLSEKVSFKYDYNFDKTYVQGRPCDRGFEMMLKG